MAKELTIDGGSVSQLAREGRRLLHSPHHPPILLIHQDGNVYAVDNRCPHMGFPLDRGSVEDGIITCHWHHARFCLASGGTFDPFADDLQTYPVTIEGDQIVVVLKDRSDRKAYWKKRLQDGLRHGLNLVIAKAVTALIDLDVDVKDIVRIGAEFGCQYRATWSPGLTILVAMANMAPDLPREERLLALYQGMVHVSRDTRGRPPRFSLGPLSTGENGQDTSALHLTWFRHFVEVRDAEGAERTLLTAIAQGASPKQLVEMLTAAATDHVYLDVGHVVDFINKACELLDLIGWDEAEWVLPTLVPLLCNAQRSEELASWRRPIDLIPLLNEANARLEVLSRQSTPLPWKGSDDLEELVEALLVEDPQAGLDATLNAYEEGATPEQLGRALAMAAARRILYFHTQNEFSDWDAVHHTFTYANALHQLLKRSPSPLAMRGLLHGVVRLYLDRFLNVPKARIRENLVEDERRALQDVQDARDVQASSASQTVQASCPGNAYRARLESLLDHAQNVDRAAALTRAWLQSEPGNTDVGQREMWAALVHGVVREDADFHTLQNVEAAWRQFTHAQTISGSLSDLETLPALATARYIAAHAPTHRQLLQTAKVAMRLQAGEALHEEDEPVSEEVSP